MYFLELFLVKKMRDFSIIVAATQNGGIGWKNRIPWSIKRDMEEFKRITWDSKEDFQNAVIMGRKTWESIPEKYRPLPGRFNIVLSRVKEPPKIDGIGQCKNLKEAFILIESMSNIDAIFVIGGSSLYTEAMESYYCKKIYLTNIYKEYPCCDTFFTPINTSKFELIQVGHIQHERDIDFQFVCYERRHDEYQYLDLVKNILISGNEKNDRTGTGTLSHFGKMMRYSLRDGVIPLFTTKEVHWRGIVEELLWFIKGSTDSKELSKKRIKIWDGNGSRDALDKLGFQDREVGDLGPIYGHQFRHFGAPYIDCHTDYSGQGVDQLSDVINKIKTNPNDRRMLVCSWNPIDLPKMALPPCHVLFQFYVVDGELSCCMYQRSCDLGLGAPFNIASYSLLTAMIAHVCNLQPGDFIHFMGDTHVYKNHIEPLKEQLLRKPRLFPKLRINPEKNSIDDFVFEDFQLIGYDPHPKIKMEMSV